MNKVQIIGNMVREVALKGEKSKYGFLSVAVKNDGGTTDFLSVKVFGALAVSCSEVLTKGDKVDIEGYIQGERYDKEQSKSYPQTLVARAVAKLERQATTGTAKAVTVRHESEGETV